MRSVPRVDKIRSRTIFGLSIVDVMFEEGVENYWARQRVQEKLDDATLPDGVKPDLAPLATAYGEIYPLRVGLRRHLRPDGVADLAGLGGHAAAVRCAGVADVENFGGHLKQYTVTFNPGATAALRPGAERRDRRPPEQQHQLRAAACLARQHVVRHPRQGLGGGHRPRSAPSSSSRSAARPIYLRDVATVGLDYPPPTGIFSKDHRDESIEGIVVMRRGENPSEVLDRVKEAVEELNPAILPKGVRVKTFYDRTFLDREHAAHRRAQRAAGHHAGGARAAAVPGPALDGRAGGADDPLCALGGDAA